jgi:hypothetical protein
MSRSRYNGIATYTSHRAENEQRELRAVLTHAARRAIADGRFALDDLPNGCDLWYDLQVEQELTF